MFETLKSSVDGNIAFISFNRTAAMNSFNDKMAEELAYLTEEIRNDKSIRAVVLNGAGALFMAGGDIKFFYDRIDQMPQGVLKIVHTLNASIINLMQMSKPVLASVHGSVAGVGMSLMLACDLVIAAENTKFTTAYTGIGISPDGGISYALPRLVGTKKAMELLLFSDVFDANEAKSLGIINWVVTADELAEKTQSIAHKLAMGPTQSYAKVKSLVNTSWQNSLETQLEKEGRAFAQCSITQDFKQGVNGFLMKKKPVFAGE